MWQYRISYIDQESGKEKEISKGGFRTKVEAVHEATEIEMSIKNGYQYTNTVTLKEFFEKWIITFKARDVSEVTVKKYYQSLKHIQSYFPNIPMKQITSTMYQQFINRYANHHVKSSTVRLNGHIKQCLKVAISDGILKKDFTKNVIVSGNKAPKKASEKYLNYDDTQRLLHMLIERRQLDSPNNYLIITAFLTGLRFGELTGLTWNDIDFEKQIIDVNKNYDYIGYTGFKPTKTETSVRQVDIEDKLLMLFKEIKHFQETRFVELNVKNPLHQVFYHYADGVPSNSGVNKLLRVSLKRLGITPEISIHGARHTFGSILLYKGIDIGVVSELLGHKDVTITNSVYRHVVKELRVKSREKLLKIQGELLV